MTAASAMEKSPEHLDVAIIGAGMSGILMGIKLKQAGIERFRIYEKASSVGGTWRENRYPGLSCDVPSFFYSYSFEPKLDWSHRFSPGSEIRQYFEDVTNKYDVRRYISFENPVTSARYEDGGWSIETGKGERVSADIVIAATGPLHHKAYPEIPGMESFGGAMFHSADWNHTVELEGKRIGVIGNGSTGVQMMAPLSRVASKLTLFQRTAQWIYPVGNEAYTDRQRAWKQRLPILAWMARQVFKQAFELGAAAVTRPGRMRRNLDNACRKHLETIKDPELRRQLTPDYQPGCKRLVLSADFYPTMQKPNVDLVVDSIDHIEAKGIVTADGRLHELDVLVLATGFHAHKWGVDDVVGVEGLNLSEAWAKGTRTYRSIMMPGFPNFFMMCGPNSPVGNISLIDVSESQASYILTCLRELSRQSPKAALVPKRAATQRLHQELVEAMKNTLWVTGCNSWYLGEDGVPVLWPWGPRRFHKEMRTPDFADYDLIPAANSAQ